MLIRLDSLHDSLETSVTWDKLEACLENTRRAFNEQMKSIESAGNLSYRWETKNILYFCRVSIIIIFRISQIYHEGVCIYFYLGFGPCKNQRANFLRICAAIKDTLILSGASLSHHHGIGKRGQDKFIKNMSNSSKTVLKAIKRDIDPKNVFAAGNLIFNEGCDDLVSKLWRQFYWNIEEIYKIINNLAIETNSGKKRRATFRNKQWVHIFENPPGKL